MGIVAALPIDDKPTPNTYDGSKGAGPASTDTSQKSNNPDQAAAKQNGLTGVTYGSKTFYARLTAPSSSNKCYLKAGYGGYNQCILITGNSCLPNCVGYAWGRVYEISAQYGTELPTNGLLSTGDASYWWRYNKRIYNRYAPNDSPPNGTPRLAYGQYPRLGAVLCWDEGGGGKCGHVAIVEQIRYNSDESVKEIVISESTYNKNYFRTKTLYPPNYRYYTGHTFQGFIYPPYCALFDKWASGEYADGQPAQDTISLNITTVFVKDDEDGKYVQGAVSDYVSDLSGLNVEEPPKPAPTDFTPGSKVKIIGPGNSSKTGNGKVVTKNGIVGIVKSVHRDFPFMYRVGNEKTGFGYFPVTSLTTST